MSFDEAEQKKELINSYPAKVFYSSAGFYINGVSIKGVRVIDIMPYLLITNHVHLFMASETEQGVSQVMQSLGRYYDRYINRAWV